MNDWVVYGGGGHARVIGNAITLNKCRLITYFDDNKDLSSINNTPVQPYHENVEQQAKMIIGIGSNEVRRNIAKYIVHNFGIVIHPKAIVANDVIIGEGSVILAGAVIQSGAIIGKHVIVNANVTIDHDAVIEDFCCVYPNSYIGGGARVGTGAIIEACTAIPRLSTIPKVFEPEEVVALDLY
ncbi:transferase [Pedobacter jeongneungensis]|uniref:PglD-related sugar-binding protein n=1 Tax=Pedobacter jeongneungensis TaxID=947309 RepID=UPI0004691724|nr:transferase [Pedobacter jeongneungensis]